MGETVWRNYDREALDAQLNLRVRTPEHPAIFERWEVDSRAVRARIEHRFDLPYGAAPAEKLDFFPATAKDAPLFVFIHGGYWQGLDKAHYSYFAPAFVDAGIAFVSLNYSLAPGARIGTMVEEVRRALSWLHERAGELGFDPERLVVGGHSAGGHLATMAASTDWSSLGLPATLVAGCCSISGVYQLEPVRQSYHQPVLQLEPAEAMELSPQHLRPALPLPTILAVGAAEPEEFRDQQRELAEAWRVDGNPVMALEVPGRHHFDVVDALIEAEQPLHQALFSLLRDRRLP